MAYGLVQVGNRYFNTIVGINLILNYGCNILKLACGKYVVERTMLYKEITMHQATSRLVATLFPSEFWGGEAIKNQLNFHRSSLYILYI